MRVLISGEAGLVGVLGAVPEVRPVGGTPYPVSHEEAVRSILSVCRDTQELEVTEIAQADDIALKRWQVDRFSRLLFIAAFESASEQGRSACIAAVTRLATPKVRRNLMSFLAASPDDRNARLVETGKLVKAFAKSLELDQPKEAPLLSAARVEIRQPPVIDLKLESDVDPKSGFSSTFHFEHVLVTRPDISQQQVNALVEDITKIVTAGNGKVGKVEYWGLRNLAYPIKKSRKAHYSLINIDAPGPVIHEIERRNRINEDILRYLTVRVETDAANFEPRIKIQGNQIEARLAGKPLLGLGIGTIGNLNAIGHLSPKNDDEQDSRATRESPRAPSAE